ncbi:MAG: hypothetical protein K1X57_09055 [Gemmataceae bacterium]|nr:hypothetical protein [Gemmataceae bacterium]
MQYQKFETWEDMLVWMGGLKRFDRTPFLYSGSKWTQFYKLAKGANSSSIRAYGTGDSTTGLIEPKFIIAFAQQKDGKTKKKVLHGLGAYLAWGVKVRHETIKHKFGVFRQHNLINKTRMNKRVEELSEENALEMASWETESEEV